MRVKAFCAAVAAIVLVSLVTPAVATELDVEVWLSPVLTPSGTNTRTDVPPDKLVIDPPGASFFVEVWASDVGSTNSGIVAAYFDISWDNWAVTGDSKVLTHSSLFPLFPEGAQVPGSALIENFGGADATFLGQGVEPTIARIGYIEFNSSAVLDSISFDGVVGLGGVGVFGRGVKDVVIHGARINKIPEPASLFLLAAGLPLLRRRGQR